MKTIHQSLDASGQNLCRRIVQQMHTTSKSAVLHAKRSMVRYMCSLMAIIFITNKKIYACFRYFLQKKQEMVKMNDLFGRLMKIV